MPLAKKFWSIALLTIAYITNWWAGFYLLGGPDGKFLSTVSFQYGGPALIFAVLLVFASTKLVLFKIYVYAPLLVTIIAWLFRFLPFEIAFYIWLFGVPAVSLGCLAYGVVSFVMHRHSVRA